MTYTDYNIFQWYQLVFIVPVLRSPFEVGVSHAFDYMDNIRVKRHQLQQFQQSPIKLVYVREPFSRLVSAYVDKLLPPNPIFWRQWGFIAISKFRSLNTNVTEGRDRMLRTCGDDVTFPEFVSFVLKFGHRIDNHLRPIYRLCSPCQNNYTVIGKMETFARDASFVATNLLGIPGQQIGLDAMEEEKLSDAISDAIGGAFDKMWLKSTLACITREQAARRVWRKLQIRGVVSWRESLTLTAEQKETIDMVMLDDRLRKAQIASVKYKDELKMQKKVAIVEAMRSLSLTQVEQIIQVYQADFRLFGYSTKKAEDLKKQYSHLPNTNAFDWSIDWDLSRLFETQ